MRDISWRHRVSHACPAAPEGADCTSPGRSPGKTGFPFTELCKGGLSTPASRVSVKGGSSRRQSSPDFGLMYRGFALA